MFLYRRHNQYLVNHTIEIEGDNKQKNCCNIRSSQQLEDENTQGPIINGSIVTFIEDNFRCDVFGRTAKRPSLVADVQHFRESEIDLFLIQAIEKYDKNKRHSRTFKTTFSIINSIETLSQLSHQTYDKLSKT